MQNELRLSKLILYKRKSEFQKEFHLDHGYGVLKSIFLNLAISGIDLTV